MKCTFLILLAAATSVALAQTAQKTPATSSAKPATAATKPAAATTELQPWIKLPAGVPRVTHGLVKTPFALRYEEIKVGTGAEGEAGKIWHVKYTGWRAADGVKFDSWEEHGPPVMGKDGKPEIGADGQMKHGDAEPLAIPQGVGRVIPGFDFGLVGMKIGGKRRIFIPWQMAYGTHAIPERPDHPGIPAKSDLIFDIELVDVTEMPQQRPMMPGMAPHPGGNAPPNGAPGAPAGPGSSAAPGANPGAKPATPAEPAASQPATSQPATSQPAPPTQPQAQPK